MQLFSVSKEFIPVQIVSKCRFASILASHKAVLPLSLSLCCYLCSSLSLGFHLICPLITQLPPLETQIARSLRRQQQQHNSSSNTTNSNTRQVQQMERTAPVRQWRERAERVVSIQLKEEFWVPKRHQSKSKRRSSAKTNCNSTNSTNRANQEQLYTKLRVKKFINCKNALARLWK